MGKGTCYNPDIFRKVGVFNSCELYSQPVLKSLYVPGVIANA